LIKKSYKNSYKDIHIYVISILKIYKLNNIKIKGGDIDLHLYYIIL